MSRMMNLQKKFLHIRACYHSSSRGLTTGSLFFWLSVSLIFCTFNIIACKQKVDSVQIKLILLNSENYFDQTIAIRGKIKEVGPLDLWFIIEDESGYIQVTTQNISEKISCLKKGQMVLAFGQLERYSVHKYFSLQDNLRCL